MMLSHLWIVGLLVAMAPGTTPHCCAPAQFQTLMDEVESLSSVRDKRFRRTMISYDEKSKRMAIHTIADSPEDEYDRISDFAANKSYEWARGQCNVTPSGPFIPACIPDEAKLVRKTFTGVSPNTLSLDTYHFGTKELQMFATVGANCTPVELVKMSPKIPQPDGQYLRVFYNMTMGIKDESVFTPPKICFQKGTKFEKGFFTSLSRHSIF
uniref:Uncharacterized protein LOC111134480 n=1 Tax=Crassostrea virginica TaxID=6565 RepID=A0A8B8EF31_CRAVI|nr:uncharacterized protein LOC111134480 [Crassostrea virginica]XP_022339243.1 uncharacterized protein LOC111134480 [Crassostrea virginica]